MQGNNYYLGTYARSSTYFFFFGCRESRIFFWLEVEVVQNRRVSRVSLFTL